MNNIFIIGPMGSGKTTIGRQLARKLDRDFYDSDHEIEKKTGVDISLIFEIEGEEGFRQRESRMLAELALNEASVIATGGGSILREENRKCLRDNGLVLYLKSSVEMLFERTRKDKKRPLLNTEDKMRTIRELMQAREHLYEELADIVISTDNQPIKQIIEQVLEQIEKQ